MVVGAGVFALLRRIPLRALLPISVFAIGAAYLITGFAPTLLIACIASVLGGVGNGIEWVTLVTAAQQLTRAEYQARVVSLVESVGKAAPGLGFVMGGAIAALLSPRASYVVAGAGVIVVLALAALALSRAGWRGEPIADQDPDEPRDQGFRELQPSAKLPDSAPISAIEASEAASRSEPAAY
jgi:MFS family permease